jgi:hypothetical protein
MVQPNRAFRGRTYDVRARRMFLRPLLLLCNCDGARLKSRIEAKVKSANSRSGKEGTVGMHLYSDRIGDALRGLVIEAGRSKMGDHYSARQPSADLHPVKPGEGGFVRCSPVLRFAAQCFTVRMKTG